RRVQAPAAIVLCRKKTTRKLPRPSHRRTQTKVKPTQGRTASRVRSDPDSVGIKAHAWRGGPDVLVRGHSDWSIWHRPADLRALRCQCVVLMETRNSITK